MHKLMKGMDQLQLLHLVILQLTVFLVTDCLQAGSLESAQVFSTHAGENCVIWEKNLYFIVPRSHYVSYLNTKAGTVHSLRRCTAEFFFPSFLLSFPLLCLHLAVSAVSSFLTFSPLTGLQFLFFYPRLSSVRFINQWVVPLYCSSGSNQIHSGIECV